MKFRILYIRKVLYYRQTDYKVELTAVDSSGRTAFHVAAMHGSESFAKGFLETENVEVNHPNQSMDSRVSLVNVQLFLFFISWL
jgi:ankyrin repeat protein